MAARTGNLPQLGVTLLSGVLAEQLLARAPDSVAAMVPANTGTEAVEAAIKISRAATGRPRVLYAEHAFHGLTLGSLSINGNDEFRDGFGPLLAGCDPVRLRRPRRARARARARRRGGVRRRADPGQGRQPARRRTTFQAPSACAARRATLFVCDEVQTGIGRTGRFLALEHWELQPDLICVAKALSGGLVPIGAVLVSRCGVRSRVRRHGARRAPRLDVRRQRSRRGGRAGDAARARPRGARRAPSAMGELLLELTRPLVERYEVGRDVRGLGLDVGDRVRPALRARRRASCGRRSSAASRACSRSSITVPLFHEHRILCQVAGHRMNVIKALPALTSRSTRSAASRPRWRRRSPRAERYPAALARFGCAPVSRAARMRR